MPRSIRSHLLLALGFVLASAGVAACGGDAPAATSGGSPVRRRW